MRLTHESSQQDTETGYTIQQLRMNFATTHINCGVVRWDSNDRVPFDDMLNDFRSLGLIDRADVLLSQDAREIDNEVFMAEYREAQRNRTPEQIAEDHYEARAAHGPGVKMVNVFTGEQYTT